MRYHLALLPLLAAALLASRGVRAQATALDPVAVGTSPATTAPTPGIADDVIVLHSGAILRGRAAEVQPGSFARITLTDGTVRTVPWSEIASAAGGSFGSATPAAASSPADPATYVTPGPGRVRVVVTDASSLRRAVGVPLPNVVARSTRGSTGIDLHVCDTPCTLFVPPGPFRLQASRRLPDDGSLRSVFDGAIPAQGARIQLWVPELLAHAPDASEPGVLDAREATRGALRYNVYAQRKSDREDSLHRSLLTAGVVTTVLGALSLIGGISGFAFGTCPTGLFQADCAAQSAGVVLLPTGIASLIAGLVMTLSPQPSGGTMRPVSDPMAVLLPPSP